VADFHEYRSMKLNDDQLFDMDKARRAGPITPTDDLPEYPPGMRFTIRECCYEALGIDQVKPGSTVKFAALCRVTSCNHRTDGCRIELEIDMLQLGDGELAELDEMARPSICLDENDHDRLDLDDDCETGDLLHLMGEARVMSVDDNRFMGGSCTLQIEQGFVAENESTEGDEDAG
jgi:hypothetical protein